ncbi:hypothetical protein BJ508DRAFT_420021 [Ascobolus immersus RN42]|uniref:Thioesterase domain-containing protein n=1 Tax=Ascobolus immersus RN42 TaxID=1160509 RepID=A0A3N4HNB5_ASCIM|nr:hypothetical protein BJ508DRAFT_420021 [Ascobolus immersus RN42]
MSQAIGSLKRRTIPTDILEDFSNRAPWAYNLLVNPRYIPVHAGVYFAPVSTENTFMRETLQTPEVIQHHEVLYQPPKDGEPHGEVLILFALGGGANGYPDTAHGGFLAVLFDELLGTALAAERGEVGAMTKKLSVEFMRRVPTPGVVLGRSKIVKEEGRKTWIDGVLEDGKGNVYAKGESFWLEPRGKL